MSAEFIAGGGFAVVVGIFLIKFLANFVNRQQKTIENHITHSTEIQATQIEVSRSLIIAVDNLSAVIETKIK